MSLADLQVALEILTDAHVVVVEDDNGALLGTRREAALLTKLKAARFSTIGQATGGSSRDKRTVPLNVSASDLLTSIHRRASKWYEAELATMGPMTVATTQGVPAEHMLKRWVAYTVIRWRRNEITDLDVAQRVQRLQGLAREIADLLDPPYTFALEAACPLCGAEHIEGFNEAAGEPTRRRALLVTERRPLDDSHVDCGACNARWVGIHEARRLSHILSTSDKDA